VYITFTSSEENASKTPVILADDSRKLACVVDYKPGQQRMAQVSPLFRAAFQKVFNRHNRLNTVSFTVDRTHKSDAAALKFLHAHADQVPAQGTLTVRHAGATKTMLLAFVQDVACVEHKGRKTVWSYSVIGGAWS
jgi:hypothetical protein